jgi:hypothetical protein
MRRARPKAVARACSSTNRGSGPQKKLQRTYFSSQDAIGSIVHRLTQIYTDFLGRARTRVRSRFLPVGAQRTTRPTLCYVPDSALQPSELGGQLHSQMSAHADQNSGLRRIILALLALGVISMVSLIVAGATSLISLADRIHPVAGTVVFWAICLAAGFFALYCVIAYAQLPSALVPPKETSGPKHEAYLESLRSRLANNPRTRELPSGT